MTLPNEIFIYENNESDICLIKVIRYKTGTLCLRAFLVI